jgi:hypothetical protein
LLARAAGSRLAIALAIGALADVASGQGAPTTGPMEPLFGVRALALVTRATSTPRGRTLTEGYLTQPVIMGEAALGRFRARGTLNLEGLTLQRGELAVGSWGEGFVDRRHPHAYVHELMIGADADMRVAHASLFAGRGFVPFGSDDPMVRPFVSFPVDHHLAQILERLVLVGGVRAGPLLGEAATFNGDEPIDPSTLPLARRFADSWAVRGTLIGDHIGAPWAGAELTASYAMVRSPERRDGRGMDQQKLHVGVRTEGDMGPFTRYAMIEWARTDDLDRGRVLYTFSALLGEIAICRGGAGLAVRVERSDRPEEERLRDLFRSPRPATDVSILGITRWTTTTAAMNLPAIASGFVGAVPFVEVAHIGVMRTTAAIFDPALLYGADPMWRIAAGARIGIGSRHDRMGRYGAAATMMQTMATKPMPHARHDVGQHRGRCFS